MDAGTEGNRFTRGERVREMGHEEGVKRAREINLENTGPWGE